MPTTTRRLLFIDNLRWTIIILVLSMHACDTYSPFGNWYYTEHPPVTLTTALCFGVYQSFLQAFFMGLLFFIAGYFAAQAHERKGATAFIRERLVRLGVPTLLYMLVIGPLTQYFLSHTWGSGGFVHQWLLHIRDGQIWSETGPMWFAALLLVLSVLYAAFASRSAPAGTPPQPAAARPYLPPSGLLPGPVCMIAFVIIMALTTFLVRIPLPEDTSILNVHPGDCPQYILMFATGIIASRGGRLENLPIREATVWATALLIPAPVILLGLLYLGGAIHGDTSRYAGGANLVSLAKCAWEAIVCVGMSFALYALFRSRFARQGSLAGFLSANAFTVYLIHPPILVALAMATREIGLPALAKAALLTLAATLATFLVSAIMVRRLPLLNRIL